MSRPVVDKSNWTPTPLPESTDGVEYRLIPGFTGYAADSLGNIYSCKVERCNRFGPWHRLSFTSHPTGHRRVTIRDGKRRTVKRIHQLVKLAFDGPPPVGAPFVLHDDGDPSNNAIGNLKYGTQSENMKDAIRHGTHNWCSNPQVDK